MGEDTEALRFNTAIAAMMEFVNDATAAPKLPKGIVSTFVQVLAPYAPHIAEELWSRLGHDADGLVCQQPWPQHDEKLCIDDTVSIGVQVAGKTRAEITVPKAADDATVTAAALANPTVQKFMDGKPPKKVIVPRDKAGSPKLVNVVV